MNTMHHSNELECLLADFNSKEVDDQTFDVLAWANISAAQRRFEFSITGTDADKLAVMNHWLQSGEEPGFADPVMNSLFEKLRSPLQAT